MSIATEILSLRRDQSSSVEALLAAMKWRNAAEAHHIFLARDFAALEVADTVLLNVAIHALEAQDESPSRAARRSLMPSRRKRPRFNGHHQSQIALPYAAASR
jgi:hypothetical protein